MTSEHLRRREFQQSYEDALRAYTSSFLRRAVNSERFQEIEPIILNRAIEVVKSSEKAATITSSSEFLATVRRLKELRGPCAIGVSECIDGREPPILIPGPIADVTEAKAGIIRVIRSPLDNAIEIESPRLTEALIERPSKEAPQILQILTAHSAGEPNCAAMIERRQRGLISPEINDLIIANLIEHEGSAKAFATHYNRAARGLGKIELPQAAITAVLDMRTDGYHLGYGTADELHTTEVLKTVLMADRRSLHEIAEPGIIENFTDAATLTQQEILKYKVSRFFLTNDVFRGVVDPYIQKNYPLLSNEQKNALQFFLAYNSSFQYITGLYEGGNHKISEHDEQYMSFSTDGVRIGDRDPSIQSFGATVATNEDAVDHIVTKTSLMEHIGKKPPYIAFVSKACASGATAQTEERARAALRGLLNTVLRCPAIRTHVSNGDLIVIPAILHERTHKIQDFPNLSA